jgi:hypothetical protein
VIRTSRDDLLRIDLRPRASVSFAHPMRPIPREQDRDVRSSRHASLSFEKASGA